MQTRFLDPLVYPVELLTLYTVDRAGRRRWPRRDDPADCWLALVARAGRGYRVVWARPSMQSVGAALGAAGLLGEPVVLDQLGRLEYPAVRGRLGERPPVELERALLDELA
ncbi:MAG: hypothetical protein H6705_16720 [Myxococcales bacterium]|nr:hypothetical protein [Myxococcales bacterium]